MSLPVWQATIVNEFGEIIPSPTMTIINEATGLGLTVYSDVNGTTALGTNGVFTGGADGFAQFFAPAGRYSIKAENLGLGFERTFRFVAMVGDSAFYPALGTSALVDTGLLTGNVPTADQLSMVGETVNYTGANYQPTTSLGLGVVRMMQNVSGADLADGASISGGSIKIAFADSTGTIFGSSATVTGTWKNVSGIAILDDRFGYMVRTA
tara:strand:+ start:14113 stop:14742 length:630 start_codon:yes stop_codon:yes gene_type:complete